MSTTRFFFDSVSDAAAALLTVIEDARQSEHFYHFGSLSADQVYDSGLLLVGAVDEVAAKLEQMDGAVRYND